MDQLIAALIPLPLGIFWLWMYRDMAANDAVPQCFFTLTNGTNPKLDWTMAFAVFNIFTAIFYYLNEYRSRH